MMIQYIDVSDIVHNLPESVNGNPFYTPRLEIDVCLLEGLTIESGGTRKRRTNIGICNIPDTHNVNFTGIKNSACILTKDGVLKSSSYGYLYVYTHNSSIDSRTLHRGMKMGSLSIKPYMNFTEHDVTDEIYIHGGGSENL